jgi:hypothetical protein
MPDDRSHTRPIDPRRRAVIGTTPCTNGVVMHLECGHEMRRRMSCNPSNVICILC